MKSCLLFAVVLLVSSAPVRSATPAAPFFAAKPAACATNTSSVSASARAPRPSFFGEVGTGGIPQPVFDTGCTAEIQCPTPGGNHTTLSCTGAASCSVGTYWVTCDGHTSYCSCVSCDLCYCDCYDGGGTGIQCLHECKFNC